MKGRKYVGLSALGAFFVFAIGMLLWFATNLVVYVWLAILVAVLVFFIGILWLRRQEPAGPAPPR